MSLASLFLTFLSLHLSIFSLAGLLAGLPACLLACYLSIYLILSVAGEHNNLRCDTAPSQLGKGLRPSYTLVSVFFFPQSPTLALRRSRCRRRRDHRDRRAADRRSPSSDES